MQKTEIGLYLHIPFCRAKCGYCDFNTYAGLGDLYKPYVDALMAETSLLASKFNNPASTLFLGGGTPTVLSIELLGDILTTCFNDFAISEGAEVTSEANPGTVSLEYLRELRNLGINRLSLGAQSFDDRELALLGRIHGAEDIGWTVERARTAGFENLNLDLIYGLPGQTLMAWEHTLRRVLTLVPEHLSLYCLTLEEGTPLYSQVRQGGVPAPNPDAAADMYELADDFLAGNGYQQYEISNWSLPGYRCGHNLVYWHNQPYLGLGAGAHSSFERKRWWNVRPVRGYVDQVMSWNSSIWPSPAAEDGEVIERAVEMGETMMLGLRLTTEGVADIDFHRRFGVSLGEVYGDVIRELSELGLLSWRDGHLCLTRRGRLLGNQVFSQFLPL